MTHAQPPISPVLPVPPTRPEGEVFGTLTLEVVTPDGGVTAPPLADWEVRAWPVARLGDATLEARPRRFNLGPADLAGALLRAGYTPLGPILPVRAFSRSG
ncbi:hypothetical protein V3W47_15575 [Deinococcus sp. YIM 134068]|uniref:hypothetical protein n=1 Tax=Deinococcus lichenicola TaxID=3118910 RepID=UPI002F93407B